MTEKTIVQKKAVPSAAYGLLLVAECAIWGFSNAYSKLGLEAITPMWALTLRYFLSFFLFAAFFGKRIKAKYRRQDLKPCVIVSLLTAAAFVLGFLALDNTSATNCGFLMSLAVVFAPLLSVPLLRTKFDPKQLIPVAVATAGLYCFCGGSLSAFALGDLLAILCSGASAMMLIFSVKYLNGTGTDPLVLCIIQCAVCFFVCLPLALVMEPMPNLLQMAPIGWHMVLFLAVGSTFLAYYFQNTALGHVSPTFGALVFCTEPIFTAITAYFMLNERLSPLGFAGAVLIIAGIVTASILDGKSKKPAVPPQNTEGKAAGG